MQKTVQKIKSYLVTHDRAQDKISDLVIELRARGVSFDVKLVNDEGRKYYYAQSVNYPRGHISATGRDMRELESELRDAIFTAFEVPARYCNDNLISFNPPLAKTQKAAERQQIY